MKQITETRPEFTALVESLNAATTLTQFWQRLVLVLAEPMGHIDGEPDPQLSRVLFNVDWTWNADGAFCPSLQIEDSSLLNPCQEAVDELLRMIGIFVDQPFTDYLVIVTAEDGSTHYLTIGFSSYMTKRGPFLTPFIHKAISVRRTLVL